MLSSLALVRPLVQSFYHRFQPEAVRGAHRPGPAFVAGVVGYGLLFALLIRIHTGFLSTVQALLSLRGFSAPGQESLLLELAALGTAAGLAALFAINVAGSAARSLDPAREGTDLVLLLCQPVHAGRVVVSRAVAAALLDPLGFLLLGPWLLACALEAPGAGGAVNVVLALALYAILRSLVQAVALGLILINRALLPGPFPPEPAAAVEALGGLGLLAASSGIGLAEFVRLVRSSSSLIEPLASLVAATSHLVPWPLTRALEGALDPGAWPLVTGWLPMLLALAACEWLGRLCPPSCLLPRPRRRRDGRSLAELWDGLIGLHGHPAAAFLLKDAVTIWRANLMMARLLPVAIPLSMLVLWRLSPNLAEVPAGVVTVPLLMMVSTALAASLFELAEGSEPPPVPFSRAHVALLKAGVAALVTIGAAKVALLLAFPWERVWPLLPWTVAAAALMPLVLIELLAIHPGGATELFSREGVRVAVLWTVAAVGIASLAGELPWPQKLQVLLFAGALARALWGRERMLCWDSSLADLAVVGAFFFFASRLAGLLAGLAVAFGPGWATAASLLGTGLLQAGLLGFSIRYARRALPGPDRFGLAMERPLARAFGGALAGLTLAAAIAWLAGSGASSPGLAMNLSGLLGMALASALGPVAEEFFFRGLVCRILSERLGRVAGLAVSAAVFSVAHAGPPSLALLALGLLNGWLWGRRRSLLEPVAAHLAFNHVQVVAAILAGELERVIAP